MQQKPRLDPPLTAVNVPDPLPVKASEKKFDYFAHNIKEHEQFACTTCHNRSGQSTQIDLGGHESCIGCHLNQFVEDRVTDENRGMCAICHSSLEGVDPPVKAFPTKFREGFNMKFSHAAHTRGAGEPRQGCAACHRPVGPAQTVTDGIDSHATCYTCHTMESEIGSCNVCHELGPYRRTGQSQYTYGASYPYGRFSHADHTSRQGVSCEECHAVRSGVPQPQQVSNIAILLHRDRSRSNCLKCHDGRRTFGGNSLNFSTCGRCHNGPVLPLPGDTVPDNGPAPGEIPN